MAMKVLEAQKAIAEYKHWSSSDELHLMLRVTDTLINALIDTARAYDYHQHGCKG